MARLPTTRLAGTALLFALASGSVGVGSSGCGPSTPPPTTSGGGGGGGGTGGGGEKVALPGDCVDPLPDGDKRDATRPFDKHVQLDVRDEDLDGDGAPEIFVKPAWSCGDSCNRSIYIARGTCGHYVGSFASIDKYESMDTKTNGLKDLSVRPRRVEEDGNTHCYQVVLKFDGKAYKPAKKRECQCEDNPKCTTWQDQ